MYAVIIRPNTLLLIYYRKLKLINYNDVDPTEFKHKFKTHF